MNISYGEMRHFCENPVCPDPVWKRVSLGGRKMARKIRLRAESQYPRRQPTATTATVTAATAIPSPSGSGRLSIELGSAPWPPGPRLESPLCWRRSRCRAPLSPRRRKGERWELCKEVKGAHPHLLPCSLSKVWLPL